MRFTRFSRIVLIAACACLMLAAAAVSPTAAGARDDRQEKPKDNKAAQVSDAERKAATKINEAKDAAVRFQAASDFVQKYPKSTLRAQIAGNVVGHIANVQDVKQRISLAENFMNTFAEASETNLMYPVLIDAYLEAKRVEDGFNAASSWLEANPNEAGVLYILTLAGADEARRNNAKFAQQSQTYGLKAIELIEADKKPATMDAATWSKSKTTWLPQLYQSVGLIQLMSGNATEALPRIQKAMTLNPRDPFNYVLVSGIRNVEYEDMAKQYQAMPAGPSKDSMMKSITAKLDEVIDLYAHAVGLSEGRPEYKPLHDQILEGLQTYYKYRHKSTDGMQQLIDKYKNPPTP